MKECGKNERNASAGQIMSTAGKALAYTGHQRLTIRPPLVRLHHEVETFRGRAVSDTRATILEMEKARTEYRAALSWMKSASSQLDPDTGHGLEKFRKAQSYVRSSKIRFDRMMLACLQKVDLLAAARCNMFSHALVSYQSSISTFSIKALETLSLAATKLTNVQPYDFCIVSELATPAENETDKVQNTFFNSEFTDEPKEAKDEPKELKESVDNAQLLGEDFSATNEEIKPIEQSPSAALLDLQWPNNADFFGGDFMPSKFIQEGQLDFNTELTPSTPNKPSEPIKEEISKKKNKEKTNINSQMSWLSLFAELDPLSNQDNLQNASSNKV